MAKYPKAVWDPYTHGNGGSYTGAPWRIVLHTTEGPTTAGANAVLHQRYASHFIVGSDKVIQLVDTDVAAMALANKAGPPQTNRDNAIQIEMVGYAGKRKNPMMLKNARELCDWLVQTYDIPRLWPNGDSKPSVKGNDPGKHNRDIKTWHTKGGFYGHEHVPENSHWDPAFDKDEQDYVTGIDIIHVPANPDTYTVVAGDIVWKIATHFGMTPNSLERINSLEPPFIISIGQVLNLK